MARSSLMLSTQQLVDGLENPVHITHAGDGSDRLFIVEQLGRVRIVQNGSLLTTPFLDIANRVSSDGEQGLLSIAFSPRYSQTGHVYVNYTNTDGDTVIARYRVGRDANQLNPNSEVILLTIEQPFANHNGGQLAFGPDGYLYVGMGDGGSGGDPQNNAQDPASLLGKILRINVESDGNTFSIPTNNPFLTDNDPTDAIRDEIWALGLRNPWRFSFDRETGDLYIADVGQSNREEVNVQFAASPGGENYGWRVFEGTERYTPTDPVPTNLVFPVAEYDHDEGRSITGGFVYRGPVDSDLTGVYLYGDFVNGRIWGLQRQGDQWETSLLLDTAFGISTFGEDEAGNLYVADFFEGIIYAIAVPERSSQPAPPPPAPPPPATANGDRLVGLATDDRLLGLGGNDVLVGRGGDDWVRGGSGQDILRGNRGSDILQGGSGSDWLDGGARGDVLKGGGGRDVLIGGGGRDRLKGNGGQDTLVGDRGRDVLVGNGGSDRFVLQTDAGRDRIRDFQVGRDRLGLLDGLTFEDLALMQHRQGARITWQGTTLAIVNDIQPNQLRSADFVAINSDSALSL